MYDIDPRWDRANGPASIEPPQRRPHKTVPTAPANGFARGLDLGEVFAGCEHRLSEVTDKFKSKVDRYGEDECWIWNGRLGTGAYGQLTFHLGGRRRVFVAHRFAYALEHPDQAIPERVLVRHHCGERLCVNPRHLYLGDYHGRPLSSAGNGLVLFEDRLP